MSEHSKKPKRVKLSKSDLRYIEQRFNSSYFKYVEKLQAEVTGKSVVSSIIGRSGFLLYLDDGSWVLSFIESNNLCWHIGVGQPTSADLALLNIPNSGDGKAPLAVDLPYADEECNMEVEVAYAHGKRIVGVAIGKASFNLCFPEGRELDAMLVPDNQGRLALRVFWEQW